MRHVGTKTCITLNEDFPFIFTIGNKYADFNLTQVVLVNFLIYPFLAKGFDRLTALIMQKLLESRFRAASFD